MGGTETYNLEWTNMIPAGLYVLRIIKDENEIIGTMTVFIE
jgi:hypothetical protein